MTMRFELSETQQLLKTSAREFLDAECPASRVRELMEDATAFDEALWNKMADLGWIGLLVPEEEGGQGLGLVEAAATLEEMGRALLPGPYLSSAIFGASVVMAGAPPSLRATLLPAVSSGRVKLTVAMLEESASWDVEAVALAARADGQGYVLDGRKLFVPDAGVADRVVCVARIGSELALLLVRRDAPGVTLTPMPAMDGTRKLYAVAFHETRASGGEVIATGAAARRALERGIDAATIGLVAEMVGGMTRCLDLSVAYAKTRRQFGRPIGQFQAVQHHCADMLILTESARSAAYYAAWALNEGTADAHVAVSTAKAYASDAYREVGNRAIQVHGGMGFTWENDLHLYYRRAKASEIMFGDATFHRERIAQAVVDRHAAD